MKHWLWFWEGFNLNILETLVELVTYSLVEELYSQTSKLAEAKLQTRSSVGFCLAIYIIGQMECKPELLLVNILNINGKPN